MEAIPVFPIHDLVVFPGLLLPLYVYEPKYKELTKDLLSKPELERNFIVTLDTPDGPKGIGAFVHLLQANENPDGTFNLVCRGENRCRLDIFRTPKHSYKLANVHAFDLTREEPTDEAMVAWDAVEDFRKYIKPAADPAALEELLEHLPDDPLYKGSFICVNIRIPAFERQQLLEATTLIERLNLARQFMKEIPLEEGSFAV